MAPLDNFKARAWERICRRQLLLDNHLNNIHHSKGIGGTIIEVKSTFQLQEWVVCK